MKVTQTLALIATLLFIAACSSTSGTDSSQPVNQSSADMTKVGGVDAQDTVAAEDVGLRCKRVQVTGTRMTEKVCSTKAQRDARARAAQDAAAQIGIRATQTGGPVGG